MEEKMMKFKRRLVEVTLEIERRKNCVDIKMMRETIFWSRLSERQNC